MSDLDLLPKSEPRNVIGDWAVRAGLAAAFILFGMEKFSSEPGSHWVKFFHEIGIGDWFRYFTGIVEVLGGILVLIPRTVTVGLALLGLTMLAAMLILAFVLGRPSDSIFPGVFLLAIAIVGFSRRNL